MKIWFHEPREGLQIDYFEGFRRSILEENLQTTTFLAVPSKPA
jgi:hypothetical protein